MKNLTYIFLLFAATVSAQIEVIQYNAGWNSSNNVEWCEELTDCEISYVDIAAKPKQQTKNKIEVVPTIIIFDDGEEIERFEADISFTIKATREEIQEIIDELVVNKF
jgi:hypothetical protein|tara:strand:+ start:490 stop:813 length:324 start_codon:yes stop_codon:yes gene_type:complete